MLCAPDTHSGVESSVIHNTKEVLRMWSMPKVLFIAILLCSVGECYYLIVQLTLRVLTGLQGVRGMNWDWVAEVCMEMIRTPFSSINAANTRSQSV